MRFVPTFCLREGMLLVRPLYDKNDNLLLNSGAKLNQQHIDSITRLGYNGLYIEDDLSKDIEIESVISESLRMETIRGIKDVFVKSEKAYLQV